MEGNYYNELLNAFKSHTIDNTDFTDIRFDEETNGFYEVRNKCEQLDQLFEIEKLNEDLEKHINSYKKQFDTYIQFYMREGNEVYDILLEINRIYKLLIINHMEREQEIFNTEIDKISKINYDYEELDNKKISILTEKNINYQEELNEIINKQLQLSKERHNIMITARNRNIENKMIDFYKHEDIIPLIKQFNIIKDSLIKDFKIKFKSIENDILGKIFNLDKEYKSKTNELFIEKLKKEKRIKIQSNYKKSY